jgi:hypothetical protein
VTGDKSPSRQAAWRPQMPRKGMAILRDAREMADQYGWIDEAVAAIHAARDAGWLLQEIGDVLGCTREYARQLYEKDVDAAVLVVGFPVKPRRPQAPNVVPVHALRRLLVSGEEIAELMELRKLATCRRRNNKPECVAAAEELYRRVNDLVTVGVSPSWLSKQMGLSPSALKAGLARYGYRKPCPSQPQRRTGEQS